jgi:hypothetical protein
LLEVELTGHNQTDAGLLKPMEDTAIGSLVVAAKDSNSVRKFSSVFPTLADANRKFFTMLRRNRPNLTIC